MEERDRKKYELTTMQKAEGIKYLLFVQGGSSTPELAPVNGCIVGDGTTKGVIEAFEKVVMSSEWKQLKTMQVTYELLQFLDKRGIKVELFVFIQDYQLFVQGRHDLCICFREEKSSKEYIKNMVKKGLMLLNVVEEDIRTY